MAEPWDKSGEALACPRDCHIQGTSRDFCTSCRHYVEHWETGSGPLQPVSFLLQIVSSASTDLQDYTYYFVPAPWLSVKLLRLLQCYPPPGKEGL